MASCQEGQAYTERGRANSTIRNNPSSHDVARIAIDSPLSSGSRNETCCVAPSGIVRQCHGHG